MPKYKHTHYTLEATLTYGAMCVDMVTALEIIATGCLLNPMDSQNGTHAGTDRQTKRQTDGQKDGQPNRHSGREADWRTYRRTEGQTDL